MSLDRGTRKHLAIFVGVFNKAVELTVQHLRDPEQELPTFAVSYITWDRVQLVCFHICIYTAK